MGTLEMYPYLHLFAHSCWACLLVAQTRIWDPSTGLLAEGRRSRPQQASQAERKIHQPVQDPSERTLWLGLLPAYRPARNAPGQKA